MTNYIETNIPNGEKIRIEVDPVVKRAGFSQADSAQLDADLNQAYNQTLATIQACATGFINTLQTMETPPQNASVSFAIKVSAEAGVLIAKSPENAQFKVSLSWKKDEPEKSDDETSANKS